MRTVKRGPRLRPFRAVSLALAVAVVGTGASAWAGRGFPGHASGRAHRAHTSSIGSVHVLPGSGDVLIAPAHPAKVSSMSGAGRSGAPAGTTWNPSPGANTQSFGNTPTPATGQITARDGKFWLGSTPVLLHGMCIAPLNYTDSPTEAAYTQIQGWNMNFVRMRVQWRDIEPNPPVKNGNTWTHTYNAYNIGVYLQQIAWATAHGEYVLIQDTLMSFWPDWLYQAQYNSHQQTYSTLVDFETAFWTDAMMQQFLRDYWKYWASQVKSVDGIVGYEMIDEPNPGNLPLNAATTQMILDVQYSTAQGLRSVDPARVVLFTTYNAMGAGIPQADLSKWKTAGNVVFDLHGYFGGRWGVGLISDPADPSYGQVNGTLLDFTITETTPPYLGTTLGQYRYVQYFLSLLGQPGSAGAIPLIVAEFGGKAEAESNMMTVMGSMTQAFNLSNISWAAWSWNGKNAVRKLDGTALPWVTILSSAAQYRG